MVPEKADEKGLMMIIEEVNKSKLRDCELGGLGEALEKEPTRNTIEFESGRPASRRGDNRDG